MGTHTTIEALDARRLMAVSASITLGTLLITGTAGDDHLVVHGTNTAVTPGHPHQFVVEDDQGNPIGTYDVGDIVVLDVQLGDGNDSLTVFDTPGRSKGGSDNVDNRNGYTGFANSYVDLGAGNDVLDLRVSADGWQVRGGRGNDTIYGGRGNDVIRAGPGDDTIDGRWGDDIERGEEGDDIFLSGTRADGQDVISGDAGFDTMDYSQRAASIAFGGPSIPASSSLTHPQPINGVLLIDGRTKDGELAASNDFPPSTHRRPYTAYTLPNTGDYYGTGRLEKDFIQPDIEAVIGGQADDVIVGNLLDNKLDGRGGNDFIVGGLGSDTLYGGSGNDTLLSADTRDGMPNFQHGDRVVGGGGRDLARTDGRDTVLRVESEDELAFLTS